MIKYTVTLIWSCDGGREYTAAMTIEAENKETAIGIACGELQKYYGEVTVPPQITIVSVVAFPEISSSNVAYTLKVS